MKFDYSSKKFNSYGFGLGQYLEAREEKEIVTLFVDNIPVTQGVLWCVCVCVGGGGGLDRLSPPPLEKSPVHRHTIGRFLNEGLQCHVSMKLGCVLHVSMCLHSMKFAGAWGVCYMLACACIP